MSPSLEDHIMNIVRRHPGITTADLFYRVIITHPHVTWHHLRHVAYTSDRITNSVGVNLKHHPYPSTHPFGWYVT